VIATIFAALLAAMQSGASSSVHLTVGPGPCQPKVDGTPVALADLSAKARGWRGRELHFQPDPRASYRCVDAVLEALRAANVSKLGFIGNEQYDPNAGAPK